MVLSCVILSSFGSKTWNIDFLLLFVSVVDALEEFDVGSMNGCSRMNDFFSNPKKQTD